MPQLEKLQKLAPAHCVLLAVHYATEANISGLQALSALRDSDLDLELILRILLTFLPESADPTTYAEFLADLATESHASGVGAPASLDTSAVDSLSGSQARKHRRSLILLPIAHPLYRGETGLDVLSQFLIHRAHRIDAETGLLDLVAQLVVPFLDTSEYLRTWFISTVLPLLRLGYEYYPQNSAPSLEKFARLTGRGAIEYQLSSLRKARAAGAGVDHIARDLKGVVGPWICGANERKRRKLSLGDRRASINEQPTQDTDDWESLLEWLVHTSKEDFPLVSSAFAEWDGPEDLDLGGFEEGRDYIDDEQQRQLEVRYAQAALASVYLVDDSSVETLQTAHSLLVRLCNLLSLDSPPHLTISVDSLPSYDLKSPFSQESTTTIVQEEHILRSDNVLTKPDRRTVRALELFIFSACLLSSLQHPTSVRHVARMYLRRDRNEQASVLQKVIHPLGTGSAKDGDQWRYIRSKLLWLWSWNAIGPSSDPHGQGIFGLIEKNTIETEILKALLESSHYQLAAQIYIQTPTPPPLPLDDVEKVVLASILCHYDNASNGNRTRGGMKRASDIFTAFSPHFASSTRFQRIRSLLSATHAMSFYSLTLQHGVPFQPVNIRASVDALSLLQKLLSQNSRSYTKLDDLISIGQNLVISMPSTIMDDPADTSLLDPVVSEKRKVAAERRVTGMAIEAALEEDDFETAYSYVANRLSPASTAVSPAGSSSSHRFSFGSYDSSKQIEEEEEDDDEDVAWRAALQAGRYDSSSVSTSWTQAGTTGRLDLRRLEQRMELLSQALLLAPPCHLEEVLSVWQKCEAEMTALLAEETDAEERFNDAADRKLPGAFLSESVTVQPRREVGRGAVEEAPMGLFDVARGAAAAFSKTAFPLRGSQPGSRIVSGEPAHGGRASMDLSDSGSIHSSGEDRVRRRDMVASAVTGGLASGIGWVLGATPAQDRERQ